MLQQNHTQTLRQTHRTMTTIMPLVTAALSVTGVLLAATERKNEKEAQQADQTSEQANGTVQTTQAPFAQGGEGSLTLRAYLFTLVSKMLSVLVGIALVLALVTLALRSGPTGVAIELTALILLALYLTEKAARKQARQHRRARRA
ncbi:MAG: hypothetical protein ABI068_11635 [Ktedonobacterales bacterium]